MKSYYVYLMASAPRGTLYTGITSDLVRRVHQHRTGSVPGFTATYAVKRLVWFEVFHDVDQAILREKRIKRWRRGWKYDLVEKDNHGWVDLWGELVTGESERSPGWWDADAGGGA